MSNRITEYGTPPPLETVSDVDVALRTVDWFAQMLGYGLQPNYALQHVSHHLRERLATLTGSTIDSFGQER